MARGSIYNYLPVVPKKDAIRYARRTAGINFAVGVATGAAVGAVLGLLFAPQSGKETREDIKEKTDEVVTKVKDTATEAYENVKGKISKMKKADVEVVDLEEEAKEN